MVRDMCCARVGGEEVFKEKTGEVCIYVCVYMCVYLGGWIVYKCI